MEADKLENEQNLLPPADLMEEIQRLNEELINERDRNLRTLADFKNYRRRIEQDGNIIAEEGKRVIIISLLDLVDDLEKALHAENKGKQTTVKGVRIIHKKFLSLLEINGVVPFESIGKPFDHNLHEAVAMTKHEGGELGTVIDELRRGYIWNNKLLRPAQVRVAG